MIAWWLLPWIGACSALAMLGVWAYARRVGNLGYVDIAWALLLGAAAIAAAVFSAGSLLARALVGMLVGLWALRLARHLFTRVHGRPEDGRYRNLREHWNNRQGMFLLFFESQTAIVALFSVPMLIAASNPATEPGPWTICAVLIWLVSVGGEALADRQLAAWITDPANRGRTCRRGLWAWSRHPNYFFEWLHWFAYALLAIGAPMAWLALSGPLLMFVFLYRVTGIPYTEAQSLRSRGDDYRAYQREVNAFFPWPPRRIS
ncbi:MAG TPA: DUF1295 domain-containing protein [Xanthomonadaceae bacterium]